MSPSFTAGTAAVLSFDHEQEDGDGFTAGDQPVAAFEGDGTYNGADGTYKCVATSADCTVSLDTEGMIIGDSIQVGSSLPMRVPPPTSRTTIM